MAPSFFRASLVLACALGAARAQSVLHSSPLGFNMDDGAITPDGRLGVVRENGAAVIARVYDMASGQLLTSVQALSTPLWTGAAQDAVEVTNTRAVVIGNHALVLDLTNLAAPLLAEHPVGILARDLAITPDGTRCIVRGGDTGFGMQGGSYVIDLATGAVVASHPGEIGNPYSTEHTYSVDSVVTNDRFAVYLSIDPPTASARTRVSIWDLSPAGGGAPQVVYETNGTTGFDQDQLGAPHDVALTPDGRYAAVRSESSVSLYSLVAPAPARVWHHRLIGNPGPMGLTSMDSVEATNTHVATASRWSSGTSFGAQVDVFDLAGAQWYSRIGGDPHDLAITPDSTRLLVRTHVALHLFDLTQLPPTQLFQPVDQQAASATTTFYGAGYDSVVATNEIAAVVVRSGTTARVRTFDIAGGTLEPTMDELLPERPVDLAFSPDHEWLAVTGTSYVQVYDVLTRQLVLDHDPAFDPTGYFPWCDGVELDNGRVLAWGAWDAQSGWVSVLSLFPESESYCTSNPNSTGDAARLHANGTNSVQGNNLTVWCTGLPQGANGYLVYASGQNSTPFGPGVLCLSGRRFVMPVQTAGGAFAQQVFDFTGPVALGGAITAGSQWNFQFLYRDPAAVGLPYNLSDALTIPFVN